VNLRTALLAETSRPVAAQSLRYLSASLNFAHDSGWIGANPAARLRVEGDGADSGRKVRIPTEGEMARILTDLSERAGADPEMWLGFAVLVFVLQGSALRMGEARGLTWWAKVDLDGGVVHVVQRADRWNTMGPPKSRAGTRTVAIDDEVVKALRHWKAHCPEGALDLVFPNGAGNVENYHNLYKRLDRRWLRSMKDLGLTAPGRTREKPAFGFHATRHFRISRLIAAGANVRQIMGEAGHASSAQTLDTYGHLFPEELQRRRERANAIATRLELGQDRSVPEPEASEE
jgi:integrase